MSATLLDYLKSGPPAPRVILLPDHRFFVRAIPVADAATREDVASLVNLSLEGMSPFPPAQLYYGFFWVEGSPHALVFSAYRKRFTNEQHAEWLQAALVAPAFAAFLNVEHEPATTLIAPSADGFTAIYWESGPIPTRVLTTTVAPEATEEERAKAREDLLKAMGGSRSIVDVHAAPEIAVSPDEKTYTFRAGEFTAKLPVAMTTSMDVRDPAELADWRKASKRDLILWRVLGGSAAALLLLGIGQLALSIGGKMMLTTQATQIKAQAPLVDEINDREKLAQSIEDRSTNRLLPLEQLTVIGTSPGKGDISFSRMVANSNQLHTLVLTSSTTNPNDPDVFKSALERNPAIESVDIKEPRTNGGVTTFSLYVTFKADGLHPAVPSSVASNK